MNECAPQLDVSLIANRLIQDCATLSGVLRADREINAQHRQSMREGKGVVENLLSLSPQAFSSELEHKRQAAKTQLEATANNLDLIQAHLIHLLHEVQLAAASIEEHQQFLDGIVRHLIREKGRDSQIVPFGQVKGSHKAKRT